MRSTEQYKPDMVSYNLEKHLLASCQLSEKYDFLYSSWMLEKQQYIKRLKTIDQNFPSYSCHDASHSDVIIDRIEALLGEERIRCLTPTDTWLILQCAYSHDLGMMVAADEIEEMMKKEYINIPMNATEAKILLESENFRNTLERMMQEESDYGKAAHYIKRYLRNDRIDELLMNINIYNQYRKSNFEEFSRAKYFYSLIVSNYFRREHAQRSCEIVKAEAAINTYNDIFPIRLRNIIGDIDKVHCGSWDELMSLPRVDGGVGNDYVHPRFIALLLRVGDLLDMDSNRFNPFLVDVIEKMPEDSMPHIYKHKAVSQLYISTDSIRIVAKFEQDTGKKSYKKYELISNDNNRDAQKDKWEYTDKKSMYLERAMKETRSNFKYLKDDLEKSAVNWYELTPDGFPGNMAQLRQAEIYLNDRLIDDLDLDLTYRISPYRASELVEGASIYKNNLVFIRELVQNAIDSSKIQLFRNLQDGVYDIDFSKNNALVYTIRKLSEQLKAFTIKVELSFKYAHDGVPKGININVIDKGIGISRENLHKMKHIGSMNDTHLEQQIKKMPEWLKPTGAFGIGMQSVFLLADRFKVKSRARNEVSSNYQRTNNLKPLAREVIFNCTELGGEIVNKEVDSEEKLTDFPLGTTVSVYIELNKKNLSRLFPDENTDSLVLTIDSRDYIENKFIQYFKDIFSAEIIPMEFVLLHDVDDNVKRNDNIYLNGMLDYISASQIEEKDHLHIFYDTDNQKEDYTWWDNHESLWLKLKHCDTSLGKTTLFYKGVRVKDDNAIENIRIPYFDAEVHILGMDPINFLSFNRDTILTHSYENIYSKVRNSTMRFVNYLCKKATDTLNNTAILEKIKGSKALALFLLFQHNFNINANLYNDSGINDNRRVAMKLAEICKHEKLSYSQVINKTIRINQEAFLSRNEMLLMIEKPWFINDLNIFMETSNDLEIAFDERADTIPEFIFEDCTSRFFGYTYDRVMFIKPKSLSDLVLVYTVTLKKGYPTNMTERDFTLIIKQIISKALMAENDITQSRRLIFPATYPFVKIAIKNLPFGTKSESIERFGAWIISPFSAQDLRNISSLVKEIGSGAIKIKEIIQKTKQSAEFATLTNFVIENSCFDELEKEYNQSMHDIINTYDKFMNKLLDITINTIL